MPLMEKSGALEFTKTFLKLSVGKETRKVFSSPCKKVGNEEVHGAISLVQKLIGPLSFVSAPNHQVPLQPECPVCDLKQVI